MTKHPFYFYFRAIIRKFAVQKATALCLVNNVYPLCKKTEGIFKRTFHLNSTGKVMPFLFLSINKDFAKPLLGFHNLQ
jgi:hypothetical protein